MIFTFIIHITCNVNIMQAKISVKSILSIPDNILSDLNLQHDQTEGKLIFYVLLSLKNPGIHEAENRV